MNGIGGYLYQISTENQITPSEDGSYSVALNYKDNLGFNRKTTSEKFSYTTADNNNLGNFTFLTNNYTDRYDNHLNNQIRSGYKHFAPLVDDIDGYGLLKLKKDPSNSSDVNQKYFYSINDNLIKDQNLQKFSDDTSNEWNAVFANRKSNNYQILLEGVENFEDQYKVLKTDLNGDIENISECLIKSITRKLSRSL